MTKSINIYQKKRNEMDANVFYILLGIILLSGVLLAFKAANFNKECPLFDIIINRQLDATKIYNVNESIVYSAVGIENEKVDWDFGDRLKSTGKSVMHSYSVQGHYIISATINGKCIQSIQIDIVRPIKPQNTSSSIILNPIIAPEAPIAGSPVNFSSSIVASTYEWTVLNSPNFRKQDSNLATFTFPMPGIRVIELKLDGNPEKIYRKSIQVISSTSNVDAAVSNAPIIVVPQIKPKLKIADTPVSKPLIPKGINFTKQQTSTPLEDAAVTHVNKKLIIPDEEFRRMFEEVKNGSLNVSSFNEFLCSGAETKMLANGKWTNLNAFCAEIYNQKKINIKSVTVDRNSQNCVMVIHIDYKKKGFIF